MTDKSLLCSICQQPIDINLMTSWASGHNASPINNGRCCTHCNNTVVIPARILRITIPLKGEPT
jgi:hypothetical protein